MAKGKLFEFAVIHHPKAKKDIAGNEEVVRSKLITPVQTVLAGSADEVSILAAKSIPDEYMDKLDQVDIVVRSF